MPLDISQHNERRRLLQASVCAMLLEENVENAPNSVIETLVEMVQSLICELSRSAQCYSELCGRSNPLFIDVFIAMIEMGLKTDDLVSFGKRKTKYHIPTPNIQPKQPPPRILQVGDKRSLFSYIPDHFPSFPDAHAYIRTDTHKQPVTEYEAIREKASSQKRDLERALTRFMARTGALSNEHSLFPDEQSGQLFPLIPINVKSFTYLSALLPRDQIFDDEQKEIESNDRDKEKKEDDNLIDENDENKDENEAKKDDNDDSIKDDGYNKDNDLIDNPYLRPTKICRRRGNKLIEFTK